MAREEQEDSHALYRITKEKNETFTFSIISRNPDIQHVAILSTQGKEKILPQHTFAGITKEELTNLPWWEQLLDIQSIKEGDVRTGPGSLQNLFRAFSNRLAPPSEDPKAYVTAKEKSTYGQNLWQVIDAVAFPNEEKRLDSNASTCAATSLSSQNSFAMQPRRTRHQ